MRNRKGLTAELKVHGTGLDTRRRRDDQRAVCILLDVEVRVEPLERRDFGIGEVLVDRQADRERIRPRSTNRHSHQHTHYASHQAGLRQPQPEPVAGRVGQVLLDAEVALGGADRGVAQAELDLLQPRAALQRQLREGAAAVRGGIGYREGKRLICGLSTLEEQRHGPRGAHRLQGGLASRGTVEQPVRAPRTDAPSASRAARGW